MAGAQLAEASFAGLTEAPAWVSRALKAAAVETAERNSRRVLAMSNCFRMRGADVQNAIIT